jgi:arylsulfatase A-like enzyme
VDTIEHFEKWLSYHYRENIFVWLQLSDPSNPTLQPKVEDSDLDNAISGAAGRSYGARVMALDEQLGELMKRLDSRGLMNRTVVAIAGSRGLVPGSTRPDVSEPWLQVPVILYGPGLELGIEVAPQVRLHDLYPTLLAAVGLHRQPRGDAASLVPLLRGQSITPLQALSVSAPRADGSCSVSLRSENRKFVRQAGGSQAFYDLRKDPRELHDLSEDRVTEFEGAASQVTRTLGRAVPEAVLPRTDPGRGPRLRALSTLR